MEIWGDEESLENEKEKRNQNKDKVKQKKFEKRIKGIFLYLYNIVFTQSLSLWVIK